MLTVSDADHDVSPLSDDAVHVYNPVSCSCKSVRAQTIKHPHSRSGRRSCDKMNEMSATLTQYRIQRPTKKTAHTRTVDFQRSNLRHHHSLRSNGQRHAVLVPLDARRRRADRPTRQQCGAAQRQRLIGRPDLDDGRRYVRNGGDL